MSSRPAGKGVDVADFGIDWLANKEMADGLLLAGAYGARSWIDLDDWLAAPDDTNGVEQSHRDIYRDGTQLSLVAALMYGMQFDRRAEEALRNFEASGVRHSDTISNVTLTTNRAAKRKGESFQINADALSDSKTASANAAQAERTERAASEGGRSPSKRGRGGSSSNTGASARGGSSSAPTWLAYTGEDRSFRKVT